MSSKAKSKSNSADDKDVKESKEAKESKKSNKSGKSKSKKDEVQGGCASCGKVRGGCGCTVGGAKKKGRPKKN